VPNELPRCLSQRSGDQATRGSGVVHLESGIGQDLGDRSIEASAGYSGRKILPDSGEGCPAIRAPGSFATNSVWSVPALQWRCQPESSPILCLSPKLMFATISIKQGLSESQPILARPGTNRYHNLVIGLKPCRNENIFTNPPWIGLKRRIFRELIPGNDIFRNYAAPWIQIQLCSTSTIWHPWRSMLS